jgi:trimethylamine--corrinoid protein Co-methyltransferase
MSLGLVSDRPEKVSDIHQFQAMLENTVKPIVFTAHNRANLEVIRDIGWEVSGGKEAFEASPFFIHYSEVISPLTHTRDGLDKALFCAENLIPLVYVSGLMAGATAPVTTTGALVLTNAEALSGLVIHQLKRRGAPMISGGMSTIMDMRTSKYCHGAPELHLSHAALADLYHHYGIPIWGSAGCSDAELPDEQAAIESTLSCLMSAESGANLVHDVGYLDNGLMGSLELVVMNDEIVGMVNRVMRGIEISDESLALDVIDRVGPGGGFVSEDHTYRLFRSEHWYPRLLNRSNHEEWLRQGGKDLRTKLNERVREILETHKPRPMAPRVRESVSKIIATYERRILT